MFEVGSQRITARAIEAKSSPEQFRSASSRRPALRTNQVSYRMRIIVAGALLALGVTILAGLSVNHLMAAHAMNFGQALAAAIQFDGDSALLAP